MANLLEKILKYAGPKGELVLRSDPPPSPVRYNVISVDDHLVEPPTVFEGRLPAALQGAAPRVERSQGIDYWVLEGERMPLLGADAIKSWEPGRGYLGPITFDELHPAVWDIHSRIQAMDVAGIVASLNFPSAPFGFAGTRFMHMRDQRLGLACLQAYNDWIIEDWSGPYPDRIIACQIIWLHDPQIAAADIRRNAARGFRAVSFSENPERLGLPSLYSRHWDPVFDACQETETVLNLHVGSSSETVVPSKDSPGAVLGALFPINGMATATDWMFSGILLRFPHLKVAMSEGGIGWVPMLIDRINYMASYIDYREDFGDLHPVDLLRRNFWFTTFSDPTTLPLRHTIGVDRIMVETDFPHNDSSWPDTQAILHSQFGDGVTEAEAQQMTYDNAAALYRFDAPKA